MKKMILALYCALHPFLHGAITYPLDRASSPEITLSTTSLNRIAFKGGAITHVFFDSARFTTQIAPSTGELFITPKMKIDVPTSLSVITDTGVTQTFQVTSCEGPGEIVLLEEKKEKTSETAFPHFHGIPSYDVEAINLFFNGLCPDGYQRREPIPTDQLFCLPEKLKAQLLTVIEGPYERLLIFDLTNGSRKPVYINPSELRGSSKEWIVVARSSLGSKETTRLIAIRSKEE